ncbi:hypothetical protein [Azospirillum argentinense]
MNRRQRWATGLMTTGFILIGAAMLFGLTAGQPVVVRQSGGVTAYHAADVSTLAAFWLMLQAGGWAVVSAVLLLPKEPVGVGLGFLLPSRAGDIACLSVLVGLPIVANLVKILASILGT